MKFRIFLKSFENDLIVRACRQIVSTLEKTTDVSVHEAIMLPTKIKRFCVLRSPHVDKDSREHFEIKIFKCFIDISTESPRVLDSLLKTEIPSGASCSLKLNEGV